MARTLRNVAGVLVTYVRGDSATELVAVVGSTEFTVAVDGTVTQVTSRDYLIEADTMVVDGQPIVPQAGDIIREERGSTTLSFEVRPFGHEPCYRESDRNGLLLRIHTKQVDEE